MGNGESGPKAIHLRYCLGDWCIFRKSFPALCQSPPFDPAAAPEEPIVNPLIVHSRHVSAIFNYRISSFLPRLSRVAGGIRYVRNQMDSFYIPITGSFDGYLSGFSTKSRSTLKRKVRKLEEMAAGNLEFRMFSRSSEMPEYLHLARQVAVKTYQEKLFDGAIPETDEFMAQVLELASADRVRGYILLLNGKPLSYLYLPVIDRVADYGYLGYDPEFATWSPGIVLLFFAIRQLFEQGSLQYLNFGYGKGQVKETFGRSSFLRADLYFFPFRPKYVLAVYGHAALDSLSSGLGRALEVVGLRRVIRRILRSM